MIVCAGSELRGRGVFFAHDSFLDEFGGIAADNCPRFDVFEDGGAGSDDGTFADGDARTDECVRRNPCAVVNRDGFPIEGVVFRLVIVCSRTQIGVL